MSTNHSLDSVIEPYFCPITRQVITDSPLAVAIPVHLSLAGRIPGTFHRLDISTTDIYAVT